MDNTTKIVDFVNDLQRALGLSAEGMTRLERCAFLAVALVDRYRSGDVSSFPAVFETVEQYLIFGSDDEQSLVIVGFLENIKNRSVMTDLDYAVFEEWIGPETFQAWRWLEKHWQGKRSLASAAEGSSDKLYFPRRKPS